MKIGLSLPIRYILTAEKDMPVSGFFKWVGRPEEFLSDLSRRGVDSIELQGVAPDLRDAALLPAMKRVALAGFGLSIHSSLPPLDALPTYFNAPPHPDAAAFLRQLGVSVVMVVHAHSNACVDADALMSSSASAIRALDAFFKQHGLPIRIALEINRDHGVKAPGVTYEGLLEIEKRCNGVALGFCWDMGHTQSSFQQKTLPAEPPQSFVAKVIHAHVHDLSPEGDTHWPLIGDCRHLGSGMLRLESNGYTGCYNLELYPSRWEQIGCVRDGMLDSIDRLRAIYTRVVNPDFVS